LKAALSWQAIYGLATPSEAFAYCIALR